MASRTKRNFYYNKQIHERAGDHVKMIGIKIVLIDGAPSVKILGDTIKVRCTVRGLGGFSAHAGQNDLLNWLKLMAASKPKLVLVHGESTAINVMGTLIEQEFQLNVQRPKFGESIELLGNTLVCNSR